MKTLLQINLCVNCLSTGKIAEDIGKAAIKAGWKSYIAGAIIGKNPSESEVIKIGGPHYLYFPYFESLVFDNHSLGLSSRSATRKLIAEIERIKPDVIQLHTIHAYYLNLKLLFKYFATIDTPIVWTLHDCWPFTGHCAYFDAIGCEQWKTGCHKCPQLREYPKSLGLIDRSKKNFEEKKRLLSAFNKRLTLITVSDWLSGIVKKSFLKDLRVETIHNGIDLNIFKPLPDIKIKKDLGIEDKKILIGVASAWGERKGLRDYVRLSETLSQGMVILLVGLKKEQIKTLPSNIIGLEKTESLRKLIELYSAADVILNLSVEETFGLTTVEGMACGTPGIVYDKTASPELITPETGIVVPAHNIEELKKSIEKIIEKGKEAFSQNCIKRADAHFNAEKQYKKYIDVYNSVTNNS